jgi:glycosyltransferase involved in cell wall biosynthesis
MVFAIKSLNIVGGGAEKVFTQVVNSLVGRGHDIRVLTFDPPGESFYPLTARVERFDLGFGLVGESTPRSALIRTLPHMRHVVRDAEPDVVAAFMHSMFVPLGLGLLGSGIPVIASEHIGIEHYTDRWLQRALLELTPYVSVAATIPSPLVRDGYPPRLRRRMWPIANPIETVQRDGGESETARTILAVGRLFEQKDHAGLIAAFAQVADAYPDWQLRVIGEGELRPALERQIEQLDLRDRVSLPGATDDVASEYARAAFVAVPSRYESFGLVTAEALATGKAVIGFSDCAGTNELISDEVNGLLVDGTGDRIASLAAGLHRLMGDAALRARLGRAGPNSVAAFDLEAVVDRWEQLLLRCAALRS